MKSVKYAFSKKYQNFTWRDERIANQQQSDRIINEKGKQTPLSRSNYVIKRNMINPIHRHNKSGNKISGTRLEDTTRAGGTTVERGERNSGYNTGRRDTVRDITRNWNSITLLRKRNDIISELLLPRCPLLRYTRYPCIKPTVPVIPVRLIEVNF